MRGNGFRAGGNLPPSYRAEIDDLKREIRKLWIALGQQPGPPPDLREVIFSWSGTVSGTRTSGPWNAYTDLTITSVGVGASASSSVTVDLNVDGVSQGTYVLSGTRHEMLCRITVAAGSQVTVTIAGTGSDVIATCRYVPTRG